MNKKIDPLAISKDNIIEQMKNERLSLLFFIGILVLLSSALYFEKYENFGEIFNALAFEIIGPLIIYAYILISQISYFQEKNGF